MYFNVGILKKMNVTEQEIRAAAEVLLTASSGSHQQTLISQHFRKL